MIKILELLKPFWISIFKYAGIFLAGLFILFKAKQSGKNAEQRKTMLETLREVRERDEVENTISAATDAEYKRLYKRWSK